MHGHRLAKPGMHCHAAQCRLADLAADVLYEHVTVPLLAARVDELLHLHGGTLLLAEYPDRWVRYGSDYVFDRTAVH
jgi:hypothetical protein